VKEGRFGGPFAMILTKLNKAGLIHPPRWLEGSTAYLTIMGSVAYGVSADTSDMDVYGYCIPPKGVVFPHTVGVIPGFGDQGERFDQWQEHHVKHPDGKQDYDFSVFSIVKYFQLCMDNNPNMIDSLFTPRRCVLHSTQIGEMVRERRREFLHKGAWHKFKGYAYSQMAKIRSKTNAQNPARALSIATNGYDLKYAYHTVRLLNEVEQILVEGDLDLERNREQLKSIRRGEWTFPQLETYFTEKERTLEAQYAASPLPVRPDEEKIRTLLLDCLEQRYGTVSAATARSADADRLVRDLDAVLARYR
jgi:predicted nucleotidyltransferase